MLFIRLFGMEWHLHRVVAYSDQELSKERGCLHIFKKVLYFRYLLVQKAPRSSVERSHVFSSFFYKQLTRRDNANEDITSTP